MRERIAIWSVEGVDCGAEYFLTEREALIYASVLMRHGHRVEVHDWDAELTPSADPVERRLPLAR